MTEQSDNELPIIRKLRSLPGVAALIATITVVGVVLEAPTKIIENYQKLHDAVFPERESGSHQRNRWADAMDLAEATYHWTTVSQLPDKPEYHKFRSSFRVKISSLGLPEELKDAYLPAINGEGSLQSVMEIRRAAELKLGTQEAEIFEYSFMINYLRGLRLIPELPPNFDSLPQQEKLAAINKMDIESKKISDQILPLLRHIEQLHTPENFPRMDYTIQEDGRDNINVSTALLNYSLFKMVFNRFTHR